MRDGNIFIAKYVGMMVFIFAVVLLMMRLVRDRVGVIPYLIGLLYYFGVPLLLWSIPLVAGLLGGYCFGVNMVDGSFVRRSVLGFIVGLLYAGCGVGLVIGTYLLGVKIAS